MRGLLTADLHVHPHRALATYENGMNSRLRDTLRILDQIIAIVQEEQLDFVAIAGDLFHVSPPFAEAYNWLYEKLVDLGKLTKVYLIAGNHDLRQIYYTGDPMDIPFLEYRSIENVHLLQGTPHNLEDDFKITGFHHQKLDRLYEQLAAAEPADILLLHQMVAGATNDVGFRFPEGITHDSNVFDKFGLVVCGDIHKPQHVTPKFLIPGSPLHLNFGDSGDRFVWIYTDGIVEKRPVEFPRFVTVATEADTVDDGNFYRIDVRKDKKTEALKLPGVEDAITEYAKKHDREPTQALELAQKIKIDQTVPSDYVLVQVELNEFGPFQSVTMNVGNGLHMVLGEWMDGDEADPGRSNASGKSTLFEAISWGLYGRTAKGIKGGDVMRRTRKRGKKCSVELTFSSQTRGDLQVVRTQNAKDSKLTIAVNGEPLDGRKKDVQQDLVELLGFSYDFFRQMVYFGQNEAEFFSQMGDADRKQILSRLLGLEWYEAAQKEAKANVSAIEAEVADDEREVASLTLESAMFAKQVRDLKLSVSKWEGERESRLKAAVEHMEKTVAELSQLHVDNTKTLVNYDERTDKDRMELEQRTAGDVALASSSVRTQFDMRKVTLLEEVERALVCQREAYAAREKLPDVQVVASLIEGFRLRLEETKKTQADHLAELAAARQKVKQLEVDRDKARRVLSGAEDIEPGTRCSNCGSEITEDTKTGYLAHLEEELSQILSDIEFTKDTMKSLNDVWAADGKAVQGLNENLETEAARLRTIEHADREIDEAVRHNSRVTAEAAQFEKDLKAAIVTAEADAMKRRGLELERFNTDRTNRRSELVESHSRQVDMLKRQVEEARASQREVGTETCPFLESQKAAKKELIDTEKRKSEFIKRIANNTSLRETWQFWVKGFGREGIPAALLAGFCDQFTAEANTLLSSLNVGMRVNLSPSSTLKSGEVRDRLDYVITTRTGPSSYEQLSGGEKVRVDVVSMLTLHGMAARQYSIDDGLLGILILDEVFSALDGVGCELVYQMLESFDVRSTWVISHSGVMKSLFRDVRTVRRFEDESVLVA